MLRRRIAAAVVFGFLSISLVAMPASAAPVGAIIDGVYYAADSSNIAAGATLIAGVDTPTHLVIPPVVTIDDVEYAVVAIQGMAFYEEFLWSVDIPDSVVSIGDLAFARNDLISVTFGSGLTTLGTGAFAFNEITSISLPAGLTSIPEMAFWDNALTSISIPHSVTSIGPYAFRDNNLVSASIGNSVMTIGHDAFANNSLSSLTLGNDVATIGDNAFRDNMLGSLTLPNTVTSIGDEAFALNSLVSVTWSNNLASIGAGAFASNGLTTVALPNSVTSIGSQAFAINTIDALTLPANLTSLSEQVFFSNHLQSVTIPASVSVINEGAFSHNPLDDVIFLGNAPTLVGEEAIGLELADPLVTFYHYATGFTTPTWHGGGETDYRTQMVTLWTVLFDSNGHGASPPAQMVINGELAADPGALTSEGYTFTGWFTLPVGDTAFDFSTPITFDRTLYAQWEMIYYSVRFRPQNGSPAVEVEVAHGATASPLVPQPTLVGHTFAGWWTAASGGELFDFSTPMTTGRTLYAYWTINSYNVTFIWGNGDPSSVVAADYNTTVEAPADPIRTGHTFAGWHTFPSVDSPYDFSTPITDGLFLYAHWDINSYEVTFEPGNGEPPVVESTDYDTSVSAPPDPVRARHSFTGWHTSPSAPSPYMFSSPITSDISLYAHWQRLPGVMTAPAQARPGQTITITGDVFDPGEDIEVWLLSTPVLLTTTSTDTTGAFSVDVTIPADVPVGSHHIEVRGLTTATIASPIVIVAASGDSGSLASTGAGPAAALWTALVLTAVGLALLAFAQRGMARHA